MTTVATDPVKVQTDLARDISEWVCAGLDQSLVSTMADVRREFRSSSSSRVKSAVHEAQLVPLLGMADPPDKMTYSDETILDSLRSAATFLPEGAELSGSTYDSLLRAGDIHGPSRVLIIQRLGSWSAACKRAGVPHRARSRDYNGMPTTVIWEWLEAYADDALLRNESITFLGYSQWAKSQPSVTPAPSGSMIKLRLLSEYSWNEIRDTLILYLYQKHVGRWERRR